MIFSSFWGGDLEAFVLQAAPRGLFARSQVILTTGEALFPTIPDELPEGTIISARGPFSVFAPENELAEWFRTAYTERFGQEPTYPAWKMAQAVLGVKAAYEKAGEGADSTAAAEAMENLKFEVPSGTVRMSLGNGHQAAQSISYGTYVLEDGEPGVENVITYSAECINPPADQTAAEWIAAGFPGAECD